MVTVLSPALCLTLGFTHRQNQSEKRVVQCCNLFTPNPQNHRLLLKHRKVFQDVLSAGVQLFTYCIPYPLKKGPLSLYVLYVYAAKRWL